MDFLFSNPCTALATPAFKNVTKATSNFKKIHEQTTIKQRNKQVLSKEQTDNK